VLYRISFTSLVLTLNWSVTLQERGRVAFGEMLQCKRMQFLDGLRYIDNPVLQFVSVVV